MSTVKAQEQQGWADQKMTTRIKRIVVDISNKTIIKRTCPAGAITPVVGSGRGFQASNSFLRSFRPILNHYNNTANRKHSRMVSWGKEVK